MSYSITSSSDACYPGTSVLINKLNIKDQNILNTVESVTVSLRSAEIEAEERENTSVPFSFD